MVPTRILIVEDENIVALDLKGRLLSLGYQVSARASSGEVALQKVAETRPDLVLMDIRIKGDMDGIATAAAIRERFDVPVIYLTAHADEVTLRRAQKTAPYGYLLKPFEEGTLHTTIEMALHRYRLEQELKANRGWLATTLQSIGDAVIATDTLGRIEFMNPVAERITGWPQADALGLNIDQVFHVINAQTRKRCVNPVLQALEKQATVELEANSLLVARDSREIPIDDSAAPIRTERGDIRGVVLVFRDISERKKAEERLRRYALDLEQKNADLDAFARTVAHDLKSPLNPIAGFASVLMDSYEQTEPELAVEFLETIARNAYKMSTIIDELLLLAQISQDDLQTAPLDMAAITAEARDRLSYVIQEHGAEIIMPRSWPTAWGYEPWVEEVWINYLSNGLKYGGTPPCLELGATIQANDQIRFWVRDNGPGLSPEAQARLFIPFTRLDMARAKGYGLGLSIVRRIVTKLGGVVGVESNGLVGGGSIFYFTLPATATYASHLSNGNRKATPYQQD